MSTDTSVDNQKWEKVRHNCGKKKIKFMLLHNTKGIDADQKTLLGEKYQEIGIVNKGQFAHQDTFYRTTKIRTKNFLQMILMI